MNILIDPFPSYFSYWHSEAICNRLKSKKCGKMNQHKLMITHNSTDFPASLPVPTILEPGTGLDSLQYTIGIFMEEE